MNPVLLKPSADTYSQVIVMGRPDPAIAARPWMDRKAQLWPVVCAALHSLLAEYDLVVIEGAGSPAEINLRAGDIVNMSVALECGAEVYLVADIDRGGAFAHLLGTWLCLAPEEQALVKGFVLNKFRGDPKLLGNATEWLRARTGVPTVALLPMLQHALPEETRFTTAGCPSGTRSPGAESPIHTPATSTSSIRWCTSPGVNVVPLRGRTPLAGYDAILLPGQQEYRAEPALPARKPDWPTRSSPPPAAACRSSASAAA